MQRCYIYGLLIPTFRSHVRPFKPSFMVNFYMNVICIGMTYSMMRAVRRLIHAPTFVSLTHHAWASVVYKITKLQITKLLVLYMD